MVIIMTIKDLHTEIKVLRHLKDFPGDYQALKKNDFSSTTVRIYEAIRRFSGKVGDDDLAATCPDKGIIKSIIATDDENPDYWYNKLIKLSALRQAQKLGWDDFVSNYVIEQESPDGEKDIIFTDKFEESSIGQLREDVLEYTNVIIAACRESYCKEERDFCYADELPHAKDTRDWLIEGLIKERTFNELVAPSKSGKSQLAFQLAYDVQNGMKFLDLFETKQCDVLYVDFEMDDEELKTREENLIKFRKGTERFQILALAEEKKNLERILYRVKRKVRKNPNVGLVVFDNFYSLVDGDFDTNNVGEVKELLDRLKFELTNLDVAVLLLNHTNKTVDKELQWKPDSEINDSYILSAPFGSLAHGAKVDTTILLQKRQEGKRIHVTGRNVSPIVRVSCKSDESNYFFFSHVGGIETAEELVRINDEQKKELDNILKMAKGNKITWSTLKGKVKNLTIEKLRNSGYKVFKVNTNQYVTFGD